MAMPKYQRDPKGSKGIQRVSDPLPLNAVMFVSVQDWTSLRNETLIWSVVRQTSTKYSTIFRVYIKTTKHL
jgi:hypothetical protein